MGMWSWHTPADKDYWTDWSEPWWRTAWRRVRYQRPHPLRSAKWFIQRGRRGWSEEDNFNMHVYLGAVMADMLADLRENGMGYGCVHENTDDMHYKECSPDGWNSMLQRIEFALRYYNFAMDDACLEYDFKTWVAMQKSSQVIIQEAFVELAKFWGSLWD